METIEKILNSSKTIAVVGLSDKPERPSYMVASYLLENGYKIIPINPNISEWRTIKVHKSLLDVKEKIDIVDIFRKSEDVLAVVEDAMKLIEKPKTIWMQLGVINQEAAELAKKAGFNVVMDHCIKIEHMRLLNASK